MSKKILIFVMIIVAALFFVGGYLISSLKIPAISRNSFQVGWEAAKVRLSESGLMENDKTNIEIKQISGAIREINGDKITLKIQPLVPLADESLDTRIITVDSATKIYNLEMGDPKEHRVAMEAYDKKIRAGDITVTPPDIFKKNEVSLTDLKVGQTISVTAGEDIKEVKEFVALEISYHQAEVPVAPEAPATPKVSSIPTPAVPAVSE